MKYILLIITLFFLGCQKNEDIYLPPKKIYPIIPKYYPSDNYEKFSKIKIINNKKVKYNNQRPYFVLGKWYYPRPTYVGETIIGVASWYGPNFHGKLTANGEIYNMYDYTAANKILPLGTRVKVTNLKNNKSVIVRINDRGPFVKDRIIDLSYIAGKKIGIDKTGIAPVKIEVLSSPITIYKKQDKINKFLNKTPIKISKKILKNYITIQIGAFSSIKGAKITKDKYKLYNAFIKKKNNLYKVYIGKFKTIKEAKSFKNKYKLNGFLVKD